MSDEDSPYLGERRPLSRLILPGGLSAPSETQPKASSRPQPSPAKRFQVIGDIGPAAASIGVAYSTSPSFALTLAGDKVFLKRTNEVVLAECAGHALAELCDIEVPDWGVAQDGSSLAFVSVAVDIRDVFPHLEKGTVSNRDLLDRLFVFDMWIANVDRNAGNLVGRFDITRPAGTIQLLAIDFEKSRVLRGAGTIELSMLSPTHMLPQSPRIVSQSPRRGQTIQRQIELISDLKSEDIRSALCRMPQADLFSSPSSLDIESTTKVLVQRASELPRLIQEALRHV